MNDLKDKWLTEVDEVSPGKKADKRAKNGEIN
jgi:hypothetical protein